MSNNFFTVKKGLNVDPQSATTLSTMGDVQVDVSTGKMQYHNGTSASANVTEAHAATLTNKSIDASLNTISNLVDANIKSGAAIAYAKLALTGSIINSDIGASAAIAYSKLNLATSITNSDVATAAAIAYSKLNLVSSIVNADIASGAAIAYSKLALTASIVNADIGAAAAIAYSKLALTGAITGTDISSSAAIPYSKLALTNSILNADIGAAAAIAYSKLNLATSIVNADIATGAAIARAKIATGTADAVLINDPSGNLSSEAALSPVRGGTGVANNAAATLTRSGNFAKTETLTGVTSVTYPTTGTLATLAGAETLSNKTLSDKLTMAQIATPATPSSGFNSIYPKSDGFFYSIDPTGAERKIGAGNGAINYVTNSDFEGGTTGYAAYSNTAQATPVTGTGGSPTVTITRTTSSPLRGVASGLITKTAVNSQGQGVSYAFTTDSADASKVLTISMDYAVDSGTYVDGDLTAYIVDVTNSNTVIQPVGYSILSVSSGNKARLAATFQTSSNSTSYRLCFHVASTSALAYALKIDNLSVGPVPVIQGAVITEWTDYTPTISNIPGTVNKAKWRRVGDSMEIYVKYTASGAATGTILAAIPSFATIDTAKFDSGIDNNLGTIHASLTSAAYIGIIQLNAASPTTLRFVSSGASTVWNATTPATWANGNDFTIQAQFPVTGWGAMASLGGADDARVVAASLLKSGQSIANNTPTVATGFTASLDTHGMAQTDRYVIPSPGYYYLSAVVAMDASAQNMTGGVTSTSILKTGTAVDTFRMDWSSTAFISGAGQLFTFTPSSLVYCVAGDYIQVTTSQQTGFARNIQTRLNVMKMGGSATIQAAESVSLNVVGSASGTLNTSQNLVTFATVNKDSHNKYSSGSWTSPVAGTFDISAGVHINGTFSLNQMVNLCIFVDGVSKYERYIYAGGAVAALPIGIDVQSVPLLAGQVVSIRLATNATSPSYNAATVLSWFSISKSGNY